MHQAYRILPVYTGDVSGVCSALFELGGMVVIHDPSGCNSTYNTHDEIRWYDQDSLIYISGLNDVDAIMGNDDKLICDVVEAVRQTHPRFVVLVNSPIPYQEGCDFAAISRIVEGETGVPTRYLATNGMHDYVRGAGAAFEALADLAVEAPSGGTSARASGATGAGTRSGRVVNVLGMTPLDFANACSKDSVEAFLAQAGFELGADWAMGSSYERIARSGEADLNLVVSATGMGAARALRRRFGTPYVVGVPTRGFSGELLGAMERSLADGACRNACLDARRAAAGEGHGVAPDVVLVGEPVQMGSLAATLALAGVDARLVSPLEDTEGLLSGPLGDSRVLGEEGVERSLAGAAVVCADPFVGYLDAASELGFVRLPHLALSGRQWLREVVDPVDFDIVGAVEAARAQAAAV